MEDMARLAVTSAVAAFALTVLTYVADSVARHPAKSTPVVLFVVWVVIVAAVRVAWRRLRHRNANKAAIRPKADGR